MFGTVAAQCVSHPGRGTDVTKAVTVTAYLTGYKRPLQGAAGSFPSRDAVVRGQSCGSTPGHSSELSGQG